MYRVLQAEADVDSLMEQVSQTDSKSRSPFKRRAGLTDEEMGMFASPALHDMFASPACSPQLQGRGSSAIGRVHLPSCSSSAISPSSALSL